MELIVTTCQKCGNRITHYRGDKWKKCPKCGVPFEKEVIVKQRKGTVRDNRGITKRPEYVKLLAIARFLDQTIRTDHYTSGELKRLKNALLDIQLIMELMM